MLLPSDRHTLLQHVSTLRLSTQARGGLFDLGVFFNIQALTIDKDDLKKSKARIGDTYANQFERAVRELGYGFAPLKPYRAFLVDEFRVTTDQDRILKGLGYALDHDFLKGLKAQLDVG